MLYEDGEGLWAGWINIWGDWAAHISYTSVLAYQNTYPPYFPTFASHVMSYPFGTDLISAFFLRFGADLVTSMIFPSIILSYILVASLFFFFKNLLSSPRLAAISTFLFFGNGGIGFLWFVSDFKNLGFEIFKHFPKEYTHLQKEANIEWINVISSEFIPQRGFLVGLPIALFVLSTFWKFYIDPSKVKTHQILLSGLLAGLLPLFHMHSLTIIFGFLAWTAMLTFIYHKKQVFKLLWFFVPALPLIIFFITTLFSHVSGESFIKFQFGWLAHEQNDNIIFFWFKNAGIMLFLPLAAYMLMEKKLAIWTTPFWGIFILANLFLFQPFAWDNTKFFTYWWLGVSLLSALTIGHLTRHTVTEKFLGILLFILAVASGYLDIIRLTQFDANKIKMVAKEDMHFATWVRSNTPANSIFLTADNHDHPLTMLSGRRVVLGFPGWLWTYGIDVSKEQALIEQIYKGNQDSKLYINELEANYILLGPKERDHFKEYNEEYLDNNFEIIYNQNNTKIYKI